MSTQRLHLAQVTPPISFEVQAAALFAKVTPTTAKVSVSSPADAWDIAQYVDLVDAGFGSKNSTYLAARTALANYVRKNWQRPALRSLFGRSATLASMVDRQLDQQVVDFDNEESGLPRAA